MSSERLVGDRRCWPCTLANLTVGMVVAWTPLVVLAGVGNHGAVPAAGAWGVVVTVVTVYRLFVHGYLPLADTVGVVTGLHDRIGPEAGRPGPDGHDTRETPESPGDEDGRR